MKEYFPDDFARMKKYVDEGRWFPAGSSDGLPHNRVHIYFRSEELERTRPLALGWYIAVSAFLIRDSAFAPSILANHSILTAPVQDGCQSVCDYLMVVNYQYAHPFPVLRDESTSLPNNS